MCPNAKAIIIAPLFTLVTWPGALCNAQNCPESHHAHESLRLTHETHRRDSLDSQESVTLFVSTALSGGPKGAMINT